MKPRLESETPQKVSFFLPPLRHYEVPSAPSWDGCGGFAVSVTGDHCHLMCNHCGGSILKNMIPARTPEALKTAAERIVRKGGKSILVSGGSAKDGTVPLVPFIPVLKEIRAVWGLKILVHTGLVHEDLADALAQGTIDCALLDVIGDNDTISQVCHLQASVKHFEKSLRFLTERSIPTAPHVIMGLHFGGIRGEYQALEMIRSFPIKTLVLVGFRPIPNTAFSSIKPLSPEAMGEFFVFARKGFPSTPVVLGCERPLGRHRRQVDRLALEAGLDGIAFPSEEGIQWAQTKGFRVNFFRDCCALID
jgi:lipoyl synthase